MNRSSLSMKQRFWLLAGMAMLVTIGCHGVWRYGAVPWGSREQSPDGRYYIQFYQTFSLNPLVFMKAGNGSDNVHGFIRLYRADGELLEETFRHGLPSYGVFWSEEAVYTLGDGPFWKLPR